MAWQELNPYLAGGVQPISDTLTVIAEIASDKNIYGSLFVANTSSTQDELVRVALRPAGSPAVGDEQYILYDTVIPPNYIMQLANIGLNSNEALVAYSENGFAVFNLTGDGIINYL